MYGEFSIIVFMVYALVLYCTWAIIKGGNPEDRNSKEVIDRDWCEWKEYEKSIKDKK